MKLYYYEHCPYCIRVLLVLGYKKLFSEIQRVVLSNDDEKMPMQMIGKKMLPILEKKDGSYLPESLDIIDYLHSYQKEPGIDFTETLSHHAQSIFDDMQSHFFSLVLPRMPQPVFMEFQTVSARAYFINKKEKMVGNFDDCLAKTNQFTEAIQKQLAALSSEISINEKVLTQQDILLYPWLYLLQLVKDFTFPVHLKNYLTIKSQQVDPMNNLLILNQLSHQQRDK